jgi:hypothetical protein
MLTSNEKSLRFLLIVKECKGTASRTRVVLKMWGHHYRIALLTELLSSPEMWGALCTVKFQRRGKRKRYAVGRPQVRYRLTRTGHALLRRLLKQQADERAAVAQARDQARLKRAQAAQDRAEAKIKRDAAEATRKTEKARKDLERRTARFELPDPPPDPVRRPTVPQAPAFPSPVPPPAWQPAADTTRPLPVAPIGAASLADRIRKAGYRVNERGQVLYDNRWIEASDWRAKMGHVDLD